MLLGIGYTGVGRTIAIGQHHFSHKHPVGTNTNSSGADRGLLPQGEWSPLTMPAPMIQGENKNGPFFSAKYVFFSPNEANVVKTNIIIKYDRPEQNIQRLGLPAPGVARRRR